MLWHPYLHTLFFNHNMQAWIMVYGIGKYQCITSLYMKILNCHIQFSWDLVQWEFKSFQIFLFSMHEYWQARKTHAQFETFRIFIYYPCHCPSHIKECWCQFETVVRDEMHEISTCFKHIIINHVTFSVILIEYLNWIFVHNFGKLQKY